MFNARSIIDGVSLSNKNSIGEKLSTEALNIYDDGLHEKNISSTPFDGEGTPTKRLCLINRGRIENFIHSESTARIFKTCLLYTSPSPRDLTASRMPSSA